jgi:3-hydroxymyristoyl/3-hydroxydecanoyl-(acyl carrier protein) dehydratase
MTSDRKPEIIFFSTREFHHDSPWFSGHFPDYPVLPGIAQLSVVLDTIRQSIDQKLFIQGFKKVKFRQIIHPNDRLEIQAVRNRLEPDEYSFVIRVKEETACQGIITFRSKSIISTEREKNED